MTYGDFKDLKKRTAADKVLRDKAFNITKDPIDIKEDQKGLMAVVLNLHLKMSNWLKNFINPLLKNLKKGKYIQHSKTIFGLQIWQICN